MGFIPSAKKLLVQILQTVGLVVLQRERFTRLDVQDLADVLVSLGPDELIAPGFLDSAWLLDHIVRARAS